MSRFSLLLPLLLLSFLHLLLTPISSRLPSTSQEMVMVKESKIRLGSTPPSCRSRCNGCRPCAAVQVPTMPRGEQRQHPFLPDPIRDASYRSYPNYKPLGWKCRCRNRLFNP